ncbi:MAG: hypothetical protein NXH85_15975 [Pseudomonadaceae bacterium]|nr:hypothetical protein [Pseudomonadaceae bacterium]
MGVELLDVVRSVGYGIALIALPWILATVLMRSSSSKSMSWRSLLFLLVVGGGGFAGYKLYSGEWMLPAGMPSLADRSGAFSFQRDLSLVGGAPLTRRSIQPFERLVVAEMAGNADSEGGTLAESVQADLLSLNGTTLLHASDARYGSLFGHYYAGAVGGKLQLVFCVADPEDGSPLQDAACREEIERSLDLGALD